MHLHFQRKTIWISILAAILAKNFSSVHFVKTDFLQKYLLFCINFWCSVHYQIGFYILLQNEPIKYGHRDFGCPLCSKRSNTKQHMEKHILTHTGEQPFACPYCTKRFNDYSNCRRHIRQCQQSISSMNFFAE